MALETLELDKKMQEFSISQFRNVPEYVKMCEAFCVGLYTIQNGVNYLSDMTDVDKAEGIWLDYLAWLVGTSRISYDFLRYFCLNRTGEFIYYGWKYNNDVVYTLSGTPEVGDKVFSDTDATVLGTVAATATNTITVSGTTYTKDADENTVMPAGDLNVEKEFYFEGISSLETGSLQDGYLRKRIKAKIAYNTSKATRNENIRIIQGMVNADKVVITKVSPMVLDIDLYGQHLFYPSIQSLRTSIESVLGNGVGIRNLTIV